MQRAYRVNRSSNEILLPVVHLVNKMMQKMLKMTENLAHGYSSYV